jgi:hypothetical protein
MSVTADALRKQQDMIMLLTAALRVLYRETEDWEDALGDERPSLVTARQQAAAAIAKAEGRTL